MNKNIDSIDAYIQSAPEEYQALLQDLRKFIITCAPKETTEIITYQMPTFRYHGNLIHFALNKKHIGLYPGSEAIIHFVEALKDYKTTKGAIQIPLDAAMPYTLLKEIIDFNVNLLKDKEGPNWHNSRGDWAEANDFMYTLIDQLPLEKTFKWGTDVYTYNGKNVIAWGGFKHFFSLWFYNGVFLEDPYQVLVTASEGKTKSLRQWRFEDVALLKQNEDRIIQYIKESIQTIKDGKEMKPEKGGTIELDTYLMEVLNADKQLNEAFNALTPGKQKEYNEHITSAKQEKTKISRLEKIKPMILDGKGLHDKYKR